MKNKLIALEQEDSSYILYLTDPLIHQIGTLKRTSKRGLWVAMDVAGTMIDKPDQFRHDIMERIALANNARLCVEYVKILER